MTLRLWTNEVDVVVAESAEDAAQVLSEVWGTTSEDYDDLIFEEMEFDQAYAVGFSEDPREESDFVLPTDGVVTEDGTGYWRYYVTASTDAWAATGRGLLASSEF